MSIAPQKLGKYELRQRLGRGNIGEVWQGYDLQNKRDVAVKVIYTDLQSDPNFLRRFTIEGQKIESLRHDNIVAVYDVAVVHQEQSTSTTAYIASTYIKGQTLEKYIAGASTKGTLLSLAEIVYLFTSLGVAIDYAHQKGIIHGNIKPGNILLDQQHIERFVLGEPTLTDFGLPLLLGNTASIGTPHYMSPEQARGDAPNNRSDIYALGVLLYELCTGTKPFRDESSVAVMMQHMNTLPTPPLLINQQLPPALSEVICERWQRIQRHASLWHHCSQQLSRMRVPFVQPFHFHIQPLRRKRARIMQQVDNTARFLASRNQQAQPNL